MNTFTEELWEKYTIENENGTDVMFAEMFMDAIKAYQSHLISEGEKMREQCNCRENGHSGETHISEVRCPGQMTFNQAITAYQAIIRDTSAGIIEE